MKSVRSVLALLFLFPASTVVAAQDQAANSDRIHRQVEAIASADGIEGRRAAILDRIESMGLHGRISSFDPPPMAGVDRRGANVIAELPGSATTLVLLGAHYDAVDLAQGAIDNAAGVAAVLELAEAFVRNPPRHFRIGVAFFDLEEDGGLGSRAMVADSLNVPLPNVFLNFDIFGYGNAFWVGAANTAARLPQLIRRRGTAAGLEVVIDSMYPSSDHVSFRNTRTKSYAVSLVDGADIHTLLEGLRTGDPTIGATTRILQIIHTTEDTLDKLDAEAVARGVEVVERALRELDAEWSSRKPSEDRAGPPSRDAV